MIFKAHFYVIQDIFQDSASDNTLQLLIDMPNKSEGKKSLMKLFDAS